MFSSINIFFKKHFSLVLIILLTIFAFSKILMFGHISWDDPEMIFKNNYVKNGELIELFSHHFVGNYIPITMIFHSISWFFFETNDFGHHLLNITFHLFNGYLVYQIGKILFKKDFVATIGMAIFLLHPLQIESVAWISELKNCLSTSFYLIATLFYLKYLFTFKMKDYLAVIVFFIASCLSKPSAIIFPLILLIIDVFIKNKIEYKQILNKIPLFFISIVFGIINLKTQSADLFINHAHEFPFYQRIAFAGFALFKYLVLFLFPYNQSVIYPYPNYHLSIFLIGYFIIATIVFLLIYFIKNKKYNWLFMILFSLFNFILVLQILPFGEVLFADRYMYVPIIGLAWLVAHLILKLNIKPVYFTVTISIMLSLLTFSRANAWKNGITLYEDILKKYPDNFVALNSVGVECMYLNQDKKALDYLTRATRVAPKNYKGFYNRALLYLKNQQPKLAIVSLNQSLTLFPYAKAYAARASAYYQISDYSKAINDGDFALKIEKNNIKALFVLGNCYSDLNNLDQALGFYNRCITLNKDDPDFYFKRAIVFGKKQNFKACLNDLIVCTNLNSQYYEAFYWIGVAKINLKQNPCDDFKKAAQHNYGPAVKAYNSYCI